MWGLVTSDVGDAAVGGHHQHGGHVVLQRTIEVAEALNVQHVHLHPWPMLLGPGWTGAG